MSVAIADTLLDNYYHWLRSQATAAYDARSGWTVIDTPFEGMFNDGIQLYVRESQGKWTLTDGGDTLQNLELLGVDATRAGTRKKLLEHTLRNYGLKLENNTIVAEATAKDLNQRKHALIQGLIEISDLFYLAKDTVKSVFKEDIAQMLRTNRVLNTREAKLTGYSGLDHLVDFLVPAFGTDYGVKATSSLRKNTVISYAYAANDIRKRREREGDDKTFTPLLIIDDRETKPKDMLMDALEKENIQIYMMTQSREMIGLLRQ